MSPLSHPGTTGRRPQRWSVADAWACLIVVLPSIAWRLAMLAGADLGFADAELYRSSTTASAYVIGLDVIQLTGAVACLGRVAPWGERILGRRIHRLVPVLIGLAGGVALIAAFGAMLAQFIPSWLGVTDAWTPDAGMGAPHRLLLAAAYAPLFAWPAFLGVALVGYWRRRAPLADV